MAAKKRTRSETGTDASTAGSSNKKAKGPDASPSNPPNPDYDALSLPELKDILKERELFISGSRPALIQRLQQSDRDRSVPAKQAIETAARKRREKAGKNKQGSTKPSSKADFELNFKREEKVLKGGPDGPAVYDGYGYRLDYTKVSKAMKRGPWPRPSWAKMEKWMDKSNRETKIKAEIMGVAEGHGRTQIWDDRVAQDLEIPHHKVEICDYKEWQRRGFTFDQEAVTEEDEERVWDLMTGSAFRS